MKIEINYRSIYAWSIVVILTVGLSFLMTKGLRWFNIPAVTEHFFSPSSSLGLFMITSMNAIDVFAGEPKALTTVNVYSISVFSSVFIYLLLGPYLWFKGYKDDKGEQEGFRPWYWYAGAMLVLMALLQIVGFSFSIYNQSSRMESAAESKERDQMREELQEVSYRIVEYAILDHSETPTVKDFSLSDITTKDLTFSYDLKSAPSDSVIKVEVMNNDPEEKEMYAVIRPFQEDLFELKEDRD